MISGELLPDHSIVTGLEKFVAEIHHSFQTLVLFTT